MLLLSLTSFCAHAGDALIAEIKNELGSGFAVVVHNRIFYIASNASSDQIDRCVSTISFVQKSLEKDFVKISPSEPLHVYLFKDRTSYDLYCREKLLNEPSTPFGFYLWDSRKLVMNIATGTGTLAHELVHPFLEADFPGAQPWFNEGFASLHEQARYTHDGTLIGLINWRLPGLQSAIRQGTSPRLSDVMQDTQSEFYGDKSGLKYAISRYLCVFLQDRGKLKDYYKHYRDNFSQDISGKKALTETLDADFAQIEKHFRSWITTLHH